MIRVVKQLKTKLIKVRSHLELLADPLLAEKEFDGITAVRDGHDEVIRGALRYGVNADGPSVAVLGGIGKS